MTRESEHVAARRLALGRRLARHRDRNGLSQKELANRLFYDRTSIKKIEAGQQSAPQTFWYAADRVLGAAGELVAAFHILVSTKEANLEPHPNDAPTHLLFDALTATIAPAERASDHVQPASPSPQHINTVIELQVLTNMLTEHSRRVVLGESVDWAEAAHKLEQAANACRLHVAPKPFPAR